MVQIWYNWFRKHLFSFCNLFEAILFLRFGQVKFPTNLKVQLFTLPEVKCFLRSISSSKSMRTRAFLLETLLDVVVESVLSIKRKNKRIVAMLVNWIAENFSSFYKAISTVLLLRWDIVCQYSIKTYTHQLGTVPIVVFKQLLITEEYLEKF